MKIISTGHQSVSGSRKVRVEAEVDHEFVDESSVDISPEELREFLAADLVEVPADPAFKEGLRRKLWRLVRFRAAGRRRSDSP